MIFVVYIIFLISGGYLKKVASSAQLFRQELVIRGYLLPQMASNSFSASKPASSDGAW
jgi:hypothetical protein